MIKELLKPILKKINHNIYKKNLSSKIIFFVSALISSLRLIRHNYRLIFKTQIDYKKIKFLFSLPRSGQHFFKNIIYSYLEQVYGFGNGVPKITSNTILPKEKSIVHGFESNLKDNFIYKLKFSNFEFTKVKRPIEMNQINYEIIYHSHHPIQYDNLIDFNKIKGVILYRDPIEATSSMVLLYIVHRMRSRKITIDNISDFKKEILNRSDLTINFFNYWSNLKKKNPENFIVINYDDLLKNTFSVFVTVLKFFKIELNKDILQNSIEINSKDNLNKLKFENPRIITDKHQLEIKNKIQEIIKEYFIEKKFDYKKKFKF